MLASHNSFTYLRPCQWWARLCPWLWRTQTKNIPQQRLSGVRYFDIRVRRDERKWRVCHGLVDFPRTFDTLDEIVRIFPDAICRIILERGDKRRFIDEAALMVQTDPTKNLHAVIIKKNWEVLYQADFIKHPLTSDMIPSPRIVDNTYCPWRSGKSLIQNIMAFRPHTIKSWAKKHPIPDNAKTDKNAVYFHDYI